MSIFRRIFDGIHASREGSSAIKMFIKIREGFILNKVMSLHDAVAKYVENGDTLAIGGFTTNRKPYATVSEILRQGQKDFIVYAGPGGGEVDMLIGEGRVAAYINCYTANSGYTNVSRRFRAAIEQGKLTGRYVGEVVDGRRKAELLRLLCQVENINIAQSIAVGDGANDLPMLDLAGLGIAFHAKPKVKATASQSISTIGLDGVLYFLGLKDSWIE